MKSTYLNILFDIVNSFNRVLVLVLVFILVLSGSCASTKSVENDQEPQESIKTFDKGFQKALYKASLIYKKNNLSGLLLIKWFPETASYRVVFMSEVGFNYFDYEFFKTEKNNFKVHYSVEMLKYGGFVKKLRSDFSSLLMSYPDDIEKESSINKEHGIITTRYMGIGVNSYYYRPVEESYISRIDIKGLFYTKARIEISEYKNSIPSKILMGHTPKNMEIKLTQIVKY